ncbi:MAG: hypothetical protein GYA59_05130 [Chloroflexi bacterium]|nr:hypothetical protein [Chloroflexota bacterium]
MASNALDLINLFKPVLGKLVENRENLNQADTYNHDHGDHMVEIFQVISEAMQEKRGAEPADQLAYAAELLRQKSSSGSAKVYANGLAEAAAEVKGQSQLDLTSLIPVVQALLGSGAGAKSSSSSSADLLGSLLTGALGGSSNSNQGVDLGSLLQLGMGLMQSGQEAKGASSGQADLSSLTEMLVGSSPMSETSHRSQSSKVVVDALLQAVGGSLNQ